MIVEKASVLSRRVEKANIMLRILLVFTVAVQGCMSETAPSVVTKSGKIVGHYLTSFKGLRYEAYEGIPYALPPIGERRFEPPEPIQPWSGELLANRIPDRCWQYSFPLHKPVHGTEDCLYLNVYTPKRNSSLPVLLYIHGGGFIFGGNDAAKEHYLMDHNVLLVTIQYRLGVLGFLSTGDDAASGNMGLKDQSAALKWVRENAERFGGDPARITLFGDSAGAASVHLHYLSPMSRGLFNNGVSLSGTAFNCWTRAKNARDRAFQLGRFMNCSSSDARSLVRCLRTRSARDLTKAMDKFKIWRDYPEMPFGPTVENTSSDRAFINSSPSEIINSGRAYDAPWIAGVVSEEGLFPVAHYSTDEVILKEMNDNWDMVAPLLLLFENTIPKENQTSISRKIRKHYFGDKPINRKTLKNLVYLVGDRWFVVDAEKAVRAQAKANENPVWFYYYNYRATDSMSTALSNSTENLGVCHGDDIVLFLKNDHVIPTKSPADMAMQRDLIKLLTSFAYKGKPSVIGKWDRVDATKKLSYLHISGPGNSKMKTVDNLAEEDFWNSIDFDENK